MTYSFRPYHGPRFDSAPSADEYQENFLGVKAAGAWRWQPHHLHVPNVMEIWEPKPPGTLWVTPSLLRDSFIFIFYMYIYVCMYVCNKNKKMHTFCINDLIQLYCLRHVSYIQVFIIRKIFTCIFMVFLSCIPVSSLVATGPLIFDVKILSIVTLFR